MSQANLAARFFLKVLKNAQYGTVEVTLPDGKSERYGVGEPLIKVQVADWGVFKELVQRGDLGLAEMIIANRMQVDDTAALVQWACRNDQSLFETLNGTWLGMLMAHMRRFLSDNTKAQAKKNIIAHYDLGNEFYRLWLDPSMTYSSGIFNSPADSLNSAQLAKYDRIIDQLGIRSGDHVLEIGCGWGGFFSRAVERTGCKVTAVMNSPQQARHNRELIQTQGMKGYVDLQEIDYRDIQGRFDKVVSIEMIEAVGERHWNTYFGKVSQSLKSKSEALIQGITIREDRFYTYRKGTDFIQQYIFPGGMLLTNETFKNYGQKNEMALAPIFEFGTSYAQTLQQWRENFKKALPHVKQMGFDDRFVRMWDLYLSYCEGAFLAGRINVGHFQLAKTP